MQQINTICDIPRSEESRKQAFTDMKERGIRPDIFNLERQIRLLYQFGALI